MIFLAMTREKPFPFGERLEKLRKERGITQVELAQAIHSTQRAISYYENENYPPAPTLIAIAKALKVSVEELVGANPSKEIAQDKGVLLFWKKFQKIKKIPEKDRRAIMRMINTLAKSA